jgi:2,3-bisphosphoglycerate-dependent phosphoglycerate mutase
VATTIVLARHGETDWNREGRIQGHSDPPLNERGREQARELAERLAAETIDALYASDLRRALETAEIVAARLRLPIVVDPALREADMGSWSGLTVAEIEQRFPEAWRKRISGGQGHDGEMRDAFHRRVLAALHRIAGAHPDERVVVIAHGGVIRTTRRHVEPEVVPALVAHCEVARIAVEDGTIRPVD